MRQAKRITPIIISALLLAVLAFYAPWPKVFETFVHFTPGIIGLLISLSIIYYFVKALRFWFMLKAIGIHKPFWIVALSYMSAQPVTLLPGGEIYRSKTLEQQTGVPVKRSISQFTAQGVLEGVAMAVVSLGAVMTVDELRLPFLIAVMVILIIFLLVQRGGFVHLHRPINALPFLSISKKTISDFSRANQTILSWRQLPLLLSLSVLGELLGVAIAYAAVSSIGGEVTGIQAVLLYIVPMVAGFLSLLPGGFGVAEHSGVAVLALSGANTAVAVAGTLVMRITIVGFGVIYGLLASGVGKLRLAKVD